VQNSPQYKPSDFGIPKSHGPNTVCAIAVLRGKLEVLLKHADSENRFVYFQVIPTMLPELPLEASVMNPPVFVPPVYEGSPIAFVYKAPPSLVSSIFSSFMGSGTKSEKPSATASASPASPVAPANVLDEQPVHGSLAPPVHSYAQMKVDEEYAKTLQQQYISEETSASTAPASAHRGPPSANYQAPPGGFQPPVAAATTYQQYHQAPPAVYEQQNQQHQHFGGSAPSAPSSPPAQSYQYNQQPAPQQQFQQQQQYQQPQQQPYGSAPPQQYQQQQQQAPYNPYGSAPNSNVVSYPTL
jgi:hypothetical protein